MDKQIKYEEAVSQLQAIVDRLETGEMGIDEMTAQLKRAQQLITLCRARLTQTDEEVQRILGDASPRS